MVAKKKPRLTFSRQLRMLCACEEAVEWVGKKSLAVAWRDCPRADWMMWLLANSSGWSRDALNLCLLALMADALESARPVACEKPYWPHVEAAHRQVRKAIAGRGCLTAALSAAWDAWREADATCAASWASLVAAYAARAASETPTYAAMAATAAADAVAAAVRAADVGLVTAHQRLANIVREHFPRPPCVLQLLALRGGAS